MASRDYPKSVRTIQRKTYRGLLLTFGAVAITLIVLIAGLIFSSDLGNADAGTLPVHNSSYILSLLSDYGDISTVNMDAYQQSFQIIPAVSVQTDDIEVTLTEIVYDGVWLYTAAELKSLAPEQAILMPGSAETTDPRSGMNGEQTVSDTRSYIDAAREDNKRLVAVYVYPKEFDQVGEYFIDHRQVSEDESIFLSGANVSQEGSPVSLTWSIQVYEIDIESCKYTLLTQLESEPQQIMPMSPLVFQEYEPVTEQDSPVERVRLIKSAIATYVQVILPAEEQYPVYSLNAFTVDMEPILHGAALEPSALALSSLHDELYLNFNDRNGCLFKKTIP